MHRMPNKKIYMEYQNKSAHSKLHNECMLYDRTDLMLLVVVLLTTGTVPVLARGATRARRWRAWA